jgi:hypothetical protein
MLRLLVSQLLKGHVDLSHPLPLPLVCRLPPVLAHWSRLWPRFRSSLSRLRLSVLRLHPLLYGAGTKLVGFVTRVLLALLHFFDAVCAASDDAAVVYVRVELPVELEGVAHDCSGDQESHELERNWRHRPPWDQEQFAATCVEITYFLVF